MIKILLYVVFLLTSSSAYAEIYKWTGENGNVIFSDQNTNKNSKIITIKEPKSIKEKNKSRSKQGNPDIEYALNIRKLNSEYGTNIPKELCENKHKNPCKMPVNLLLQPINNFNEAKHNLTGPAWNALKKHSSAGKATWEFNLCQEKWKNDKYCVPVNGYIVIKNGIAIFYTFFIKDISSDPERVKVPEAIEKAPDPNKKQTKIVSWEVAEDHESRIVIGVKYFYDGKFKNDKIWLSAYTLENGSRSMNYAVRPVKITEGEGIVNIRLSVNSRAPKRHCTNQITFQMYGKDISTFHKATVDFSKCWTNNNTVPAESQPTRIIK